MKAIYSLILLALVVGCQPTTEESNTSAWPSDGIAYEIFVQSFVDSDGDGIGDIDGMASKLDYLDDLGVDAVWLMPIMPSPSYHKYDVTNYKAIHPDYGTMADFKHFVAEAHSRDIKVIIDLIINHTSSQHPWFLNAKTGPNAEYRDYYVWANKDSVAAEIEKMEISLDSDNITQWHPVDGDTLADHYYGFFYGGMPDLNFDNPKVREEVYGIGKFWLEEVGVDGFRMDAAKHIYPDERAADSHAFWREFKAEMEKIKPDVYIVGEVWANTATQAPYVKGFTALFDFDLAFSILETVKRGYPVAASVAGHAWKIDTTQSFINKLIQNTQAYHTVNPEFVDAIFLSNHDQNRVMSVLDNNEAKARLAASIMLTLPGTPYIYYGEEIGMRGMKPDPNIREPYLWQPIDKSNIRTKWMEPVYSTDQTITPQVEQKKALNSLYNHYKDLIAVRKANPAISIGSLEEENFSTPHVWGYRRTLGGQSILIIHNLSSGEQRQQVPDDVDMIFGDKQWLENGVISLPGYSSVILKQ